MIGRLQTTRQPQPRRSAIAGATLRRACTVAVVALAYGLASCVAEPALEPAAGPTTLDAGPDPHPDGLRPGLAVRYWFALLRDVRGLEDWMRHRRGMPGEPLAGLDHMMGDGPVLTSGVTDAVGAEITGFIHLAARGRYVFFANSNDGLRVEIAGAVVADDPGVHGDRLSPPRSMDVAAPGWYALRVLYFERRNTATLQLFWIAPGAVSPVIVPSSALRHRQAPR